jgi:hypothetical protein
MTVNVKVICMKGSTWAGFEKLKYLVLEEFTFQFALFFDYYI